MRGGEEGEGGGGGRDAGKWGVRDERWGRGEGGGRGRDGGEMQENGG